MQGGSANYYLVECLFNNSILFSICFVIRNTTS